MCVLRGMTGVMIKTGKIIGGKQKVVTKAFVKKKKIIVLLMSRITSDTHSETYT